LPVVRDGGFDARRLEEERDSAYCGFTVARMALDGGARSHCSSVGFVWRMEPATRVATD